MAKIADLESKEQNDILQRYSALEEYIHNLFFVHRAVSGVNSLCGHTDVVQSKRTSSVKDGLKMNESATRPSPLGFVV